MNSIRPLNFEVCSLFVFKLKVSIFHWNLTQPMSVPFSAKETSFDSNFFFNRFFLLGLNIWMMKLFHGFWHFHYSEIETWYTRLRTLERFRFVSFGFSFELWHEVIFSISIGAMGGPKLDRPRHPSESVKKKKKLSEKTKSRGKEKEATGNGHAPID